MVGQQVEELIKPFRGQSGALIQALHRLQVAFGYLPKLGMIRVAEELGVAMSEVYGVATFYAFFSLKPKGRHVINVCMGTACYVKGSTNVVKRLEQELGVAVGDTTEDGRFSLEIVRCLGACGLGPVLMIGEDVHARVKVDRIPELLRSYQ
ncbi:MAG TPA: NADH-quinone oxidoreductase subunit NuoE [Clostridiales bacterium UBA8153]|nr:NADH-quinone oxidoreductase subunit NuoE [Clostridiales bacterium UBA8153]